MIKSKKIISSLTAIIIAASTLCVNASADSYAETYSTRGISGVSTVRSYTAWRYNGRNITSKNSQVDMWQTKTGSKIGGINFIVGGGSNILTSKSSDTCKYINHKTETNMNVSVTRLIGAGFHVGWEVTDQHQIWYDGDCWFYEDIYNQL